MARLRPDLVFQHSIDSAGSAQAEGEPRRGPDPEPAETSLHPSARAYASLKARGWSHDRIVDELAHWVLDALRDGRIEAIERTVGPGWATQDGC